MTPQIAFIGAGNMARAMISGLLARGFSSDQLRASDPSQGARDAITALGVSQVSADPRACLTGANLAVLAVKPQVAPEALNEIAPALEGQTALLSIAAGITTETLANHVPVNTPIIRCMPNTPAMVGKGATALYAPDSVSQNHRDLAQQVTEAVGLAIWVKAETLLDAVTAVSGSGPAYFFALLEAMIDAGIHLGLDSDQASALALQTALGAAELAQHSEHSVSDLRRQVTSPGGTTEAALEALSEGDFSKLVATAMARCAARAEALGKEFG